MNLRLLVFFFSTAWSMITLALSEVCALWVSQVSSWYESPILLYYQGKVENSLRGNAFALMIWCWTHPHKHKELNVKIKEGIAAHHESTHQRSEMSRGPLSGWHWDSDSQIKWDDVIRWDELLILSNKIKASLFPVIGAFTRIRGTTAGRSLHSCSPGPFCYISDLVECVDRKWTVDFNIL